MHTPARNSILALLVAAISLLLAPSPTPAQQPINAVENLQRCKESVFQLRVALGNDVESLGTGFVIDAAGRAISNYHVVKRGKSATAKFPDGRSAKVELLAVDPQLDLALLQLQTPKGETPSWSPLPLVAKDTAEGTEVYALGFPEDLGWTVTRGVVSGYRMLDELPMQFRKACANDARSRWVQTDCAMNPGNSGGPLVNKAGEVVGICTWKWMDKQSMSFALTSSLAGEFASKPPANAIGFGHLPAEKHDVEMVPTLDIARIGNAESVNSAATQFKKMAMCQQCKGEGHIHESTGIGKSRDAVCPGCAGNKFNKPDRVRDQARKLVQSLMRLSPTDAKRDQAKIFAQGAVEAVANTDPQDLLRATRDMAIRDLTTTDPRVGDAIVFVGTLCADTTRTDMSDRVLTLVLYGTSQFVTVTAPDVINALPGDSVAVAGLLSGHVIAPDGSHLPFLHGGFVVRTNLSKLSPPPMPKPVSDRR